MVHKEGWEKKKMGEVYDVKDGTHDSPKYVENGYALITSKNLKQDAINFDNLNYITEEDYININKRSKVDVGDILFAMIGTIGNPVVVKHDVNFAIKNVALFKVPENQNSYFLKYYLSLKAVIDKMTKNAKGATQKFVGLNYLRNFSISIPPLPIQHQIVSELDTLSDIITKKKQQLADLASLAQATFYDMFGDPVINEKSWDFKTIEQLVIKDRHAIKRGPFGGALKKEIFVDSGYLVYEQFHALNNDFSFARYFIDENDYQRLKTFEVHSGDIIISCSGVYLGKLAIVPENSKKGIINQALLKISLDKNIIDSRFFVFVFSNENFKRTYYGNTIGSGIPNFPPMNDFKKFKFICPPFQLQLQFNKKIVLIEKQKQLINQSIADVQQLFDYTMDKYFN